MLGLQLLNKVVDVFDKKRKLTLLTFMDMFKLPQDEVRKVLLSGAR